MEDSGGHPAKSRSVEDRQLRSRRHWTLRPGDQGPYLSGADDRTTAGSPRLCRAHFVDRVRRAGRQAGDAEAAVAVEADQRLFQRRHRAAVSAGDVEPPVELDRGEAVPWQRLRLEAAVGAEDDVVNFDEGAGGGAHHGRECQQGEQPNSLQRGE
jgi:hypothetical protein